MDARSHLTGAGILALHPVPGFYLFSTKELAPQEDQGVVFGIVQAAPNATIDQTSRFTEKVNDVFKGLPGNGGDIPDHRSQRRLLRHGDEAVERAAPRHRSRSWARSSARSARSRACGSSPPRRSRCPGGSQFPIEFVINSTAEPREIYELRKPDRAKGDGEQECSCLPIRDLKFDQPQTEVVFDRDKVAALGLNLSQVGADLGTLLGGNYVNRFSIQGRSYKVIPEVKRSARLNVDQLQDYYVSGPERKAGAALDLRAFQDDRAAAHAEPVPAIEFREDSGGHPALGLAGYQALKVLEDAAQGFAERLHDRLRRLFAAVAGGGQQAHRDAGAFDHPDFPGAGRAVRELPRSLHHPARLRAAGHHRRAAARLPRVYHLQYLQPGRT